jgi:uncharacterized repeat protein (TIGR03943 family)
VKRPIQAVLLVLGGIGLLHSSLFTDLCLRYVKEGMRPMLIASGALLLLLGAAEAWPYWRTGGDDEHGDRPEHEGHDGDGHGHDHSGVPRVAWLLFLPALSLLFYAPPALGAYTASRQPPKAVTEQKHFDPLPATSPVPMTLTDFTRRVQQDRKQAVKGRSVRMTGFVTPDRQGHGWYLTRLILNCCAADAQSVKVRIHGTPAPPANTWVTVTGPWHPGGTLGTKSAPAALDARTVKKVARPANGYTDALPLTPS